MNNAEKLQRAAKIATALAIPNTLLAIPGLIATFYAVLTVVYIPLPIIGYLLLYEYWLRAKRVDEPAFWLWVVTIVFNALPFALVLLQGNGLHPLLLWNAYMILGAAWGLKLDWTVLGEELRKAETLAV